MKLIIRYTSDVECSSFIVQFFCGYVPHSDRVNIIPFSSRRLDIRRRTQATAWSISLFSIQIKIHCLTDLFVFFLLFLGSSFKRVFPVFLPLSTCFYSVCFSDRLFALNNKRYSRHVVDETEFCVQRPNCLFASVSSDETSHEHSCFLPDNSHICPCAL